MSHPFNLNLNQLQAIDLEFEELLTPEAAAEVSGALSRLPYPPRPRPRPRPRPPLNCPPNPPIAHPQPINPPIYTTLALGEEGGWHPPEVTTMALGEEGGSLDPFS